MRPLFSRTQELRAQAPRGWRGKLWRWLTEPAATLQEPYRRRQAQLLASLLTALFLIGAVLEGVTILLMEPSEHYTGYTKMLAALGLLTIAYGLSRTRHYALGAALAVIITSIVIFATAFNELWIEVFGYLVVPILFGSVFLPTRTWLWLTAADLAGMLFVPLFVPSIAYPAILIGPWSYVGATAALFLVLFQHRDLVERDRRAELTRERNLLRTLIDNLPDSIYAKDAASRFTLSNLSVARSMGAAAPNDVVGKTDLDFYPPELAARYAADDQVILQSGRPLINREEPTRDAAGHQRWTLTTKVPLRDDRGRVVGLVGIGRDITERKHAEETLRESEVKYRTLVEQLPAITYLDAADPVSPTGFVNLYVSPQFQEFLGYSPEEYQSDPHLWYQMIHPEDRTRVVAEDTDHCRVRPAHHPRADHWRAVGGPGPGQRVGALFRPRSG